MVSITCICSSASPTSCRVAPSPYDNTSSVSGDRSLSRSHTVMHKQRPPTSDAASCSHLFSFCGNASMASLLSIYRKRGTLWVPLENVLDRSFSVAVSGLHQLDVHVCNVSTCHWAASEELHHADLQCWILNSLQFALRNNNLLASCWKRIFSTIDEHTWASCGVSEIPASSTNVVTYLLSVWLVPWLSDVYHARARIAANQRRVSVLATDSGLSVNVHGFRRFLSPASRLCVIGFR